MKFAPCVLLALLVVSNAFADGPSDNSSDNVRRVPALGVDVSAADRAELEKGIATLGEAIARLEKKDAKSKALLPDITIYHKAAHDALKYQEFFNVNEIPKAKALLQEGLQRAEQLEQGQAPWTTATGPVVRGYISKIDGSVQPYGIVVPESYTPKTAAKYRLDIWLHGRTETLSEVNFLDEHRKSSGQFTPADTLVLHPYGRYCNAFKFAGEIDVLEALDHAKKNYRVEEDLVAVRGFSMGGAGCWHLAVHYPGLWFAANPGAGFAETAEFLKAFQKEDLKPTDYEKSLWRWYDCPFYAGNLRHVPTVAYSGADDPQKQAADLMTKALESEEIDLMHVIGPGTKHAYHPASKEIVEQKLAELALVGRDRSPQHIRFTTQTLRYHELAWVNITGLGQHWKTARVDATVGTDEVSLRTDNVTDLTLSFPAGASPFEITDRVAVEMDGERLAGPRSKSDKSWEVSLHHDGQRWKVGERKAELRKTPGQQGPIDDAFMDSFVFVRPTGRFQNADVEKWCQAEMERAIEHWRRHFRGEARVVNDTQVDDALVQSANIVLWGDPTSNAVLTKIGKKIPIVWDDKEIAIGKYKYPIDKHVLLAIYPNPLNPKRYVVLNSGFTFRDYDYLNNARQVPKLPDWAVIDFTTPPGPRLPGKIADQGFFNEKWETGF